MCLILLPAKDSQCLILGYIWKALEKICDGQSVRGCIEEGLHRYARASEPYRTTKCVRSGYEDRFKLLRNRNDNNLKSSTVRRIPSWPIADLIPVRHST